MSLKKKEAPDSLFEFIFHFSEDHSSPSGYLEVYFQFCAPKEKGYLEFSFKF